MLNPESNIAQLVEWWTHDQEVAGLNPTISSVLIVSLSEQDILSSCTQHVYGGLKRTVSIHLMRQFF